VGCNEADPAANRNAEIPNLGDIQGGTFSFGANTQYLLVLSASDQHYCLANTNCNGVVYGNTGWSDNGNFRGLQPTYDIVFSFNGDPPSIDAGPTTVTDFPVATAVPEPTSAVMFLSGILLLPCQKVRRQRSHRRKLGTHESTDSKPAQLNHRAVHSVMPATP